MAVLESPTVAAQYAEVDSDNNLYVRSGVPAVPAAGGFYSVAGGPAGIVAAGLAIDTSLMAMRFSASSTRVAYVTRLLFTMSPATLGAAAGVGGSLALQRFTTATPTGGTARTVQESNEASTATDMTSVQDLATALTVTSVVFGGVVARWRVPIFTVGAPYVVSIEFDHPIRLTAGDGLCLRTAVAMAATQTWVFDYAVQWFEK